MGLCILALVCPAGIIIPRLFHAQGAWGEWHSNEIRQQTGVTPSGMMQNEKLWKAPMEDYRIGKKEKGLWWDIFSYLAAAVCGLVVIGLLTAWVNLKAKNNEQKAT